MPSCLAVSLRFALGLLMTGDYAVFHYKCTAVYNPKSEGPIAWNDPAIAIDWSLSDVRLSAKDNTVPRLAEVPEDRLFIFDNRS